MIAFDLSCSCGYQFEAWFHGRDDFDEQQRQGILRCPSCGGFDVHKILSPVAVQRGARESIQDGRAAMESGEVIRKILKAVSQYVTNHFEDVGTRLAEKSLRIHYGIDEPRNLRGVVTEKEEGVLQEEGIELLKVPILPEEGNESSN